MPNCSRTRRYINICALISPSHSTKQFYVINCSHSCMFFQLGWMEVTTFKSWNAISVAFRQWFLVHSCRSKSIKNCWSESSLSTLHDREREITTCVGMNEELSTLTISASSYVNMKQAHRARLLDKCYDIILVSFWWSGGGPSWYPCKEETRESPLLTEGCKLVCCVFMWVPWEWVLWWQDVFTSTKHYNLH